MDLKAFFKKLRSLEGEIGTPYIHVVSLATPDGGVDGVVTETPLRVGCELVVTGKARIATPEEVAKFRRDETEKREVIEREVAASRIQLQVVTAKEPNPVQK